MIGERLGVLVDTSPTGSVGPGMTAITLPFVVPAVPLTLPGYAFAVRDPRNRDRY